MNSITFRAFATRHPLGYIVVNLSQTNKDDVEMEVEETDAQLTMEDADVMPQVGHVIWVNGLTTNVVVVATK